MPDYLKFFPHLSAANHKQTSPKTPHYNCIAWAADDDSRWWGPVDPYYWPPGATLGMEVDCLIEAFKTLGYDVCPDGDVEDGIGKVAIYADVGGRWTHAARQLSTGKWTSKLGVSEDIEHDLPEGVSGIHYGAVFCFMMRPI